jgi:hypothetical protein
MRSGTATNHLVIAVNPHGKRISQRNSATAYSKFTMAVPSSIKYGLLFESLIKQGLCQNSYTTPGKEPLYYTRIA